MARLRQPPPPPAAAGEVPALLIEPLHPHWRDHALADLPDPGRYAVTWRGKPVADGIARWRSAATAWALAEGILNPKHPLLPDWDRLAELGIRPPTALQRARAVSMVPSQSAGQPD